MKKPIIGITSAYEREEELLNYHRTTVSIDYTKSIVATGGIPIVLPVTDDRTIIKAQLSLIDGLILSGGADINPLLYGQDFKAGIGTVSPERDNYEMIVLEEFLKTGHQLLNVYFGGTLFQDAQYYKGELVNHRQKIYPDMVTHKVNIIEQENILFEAYGREIITNSFHHQFIDKLGDGLTAIAKSNDGVVEAIQMKGHKFLYGIQWHPEMMIARKNEQMKEIFKKFIEASSY